MPQTDVIFYADEKAVAPALVWIDEQPEKVRLKLLVAIEHLEAAGYEARRPLAAPLRDKIYELRVRYLNVNYRLLYFFHGRQVVVIAHGCTKEAAVDPRDIDVAVARRTRFLGNPKKHMYEEE